MSGLASGNGFSVTRTQSFTDIQTNALSADNANVTNNERVSNNATDKGSILMGGSDALFNSKALVPLTANGETQNQTLNVTTVTTFQEYSLGTQYRTGKNTYRYVSFSRNEVKTPGLVLEQNTTGTEILVGFGGSQAIGDTTINFVAASGAAFVANFFAGGIMSVEDDTATTGQGATYRIISNTATTGAGQNFTVVLDPNTPLVAPIVIPDEITLVPNSYSSVRVSTPTLGGPLLGINITNVASVAALQYGWIQTSGDATVRSENGIAYAAGELCYIIAAGGTAGHVNKFAGTPGGVTLAEVQANIGPVGSAMLGITVSAVGEGIAIRMSNAVIPA